MAEQNVRVAVDIGGTFTDLVAYVEGSDGPRFSKSLTTYDSLDKGVFDCVRLADVSLPEAAYLVHGSTIAINTVIQRRGVKTGLITTAGFRDIYAIARGTRPDPYNLLFQRAAPLVPRDLIAEVDERVDAFGEVVRGLDEDDVRRAVEQLRGEGVDAIAVVLLHAYRNPVHEIAVREAIARIDPNIYVSISSEILREFREYERTSTTVLNAYIGPIVGSYVQTLKKSLTNEGFDGRLLIMQSNGGTMSPDTAFSRPVTMMESGPVAGVIGCARLGEALGIPDVISFDMGGTTAKTSLIEKGETKVVTGYHIGGTDVGHPMMLPVVDIVEVGAGGGSIAWIDAAGGLKVGPQSAGSTPGPACYGRGGEDPTITDANLVLGRLDADSFLAGQMKLDLDAAKRAIQTRIAEPLGLSLIEAALGIIKIADTKMSLAVREVSVSKGHDPRSFALVATGGAGPLHACSIARELSLPSVIVPDLPGTFSALGMLMTDIRHDYVRTLITSLNDSDPAELEAAFAEMIREALEVLAVDGISADDTVVQRSFDMRYVGQEFTLPISIPAGTLDADLLAQVRGRFDAQHETQFSHSAAGEPVEVVNLRLTAIGKFASGQDPFQPLPGDKPRDGKAKGKRPVSFDEGTFECPVYDRTTLQFGQSVAGPAIIEETVSTIVVPPDSTARLTGMGPIIITFEG